MSRDKLSIELDVVQTIDCKKRRTILSDLGDPFSKVILLYLKRITCYIYISLYNDCMYLQGPKVKYSVRVSYSYFTIRYSYSPMLASNGLNPYSS